MEFKDCNESDDGADCRLDPQLDDQSNGAETEFEFVIDPTGPPVPVRRGKFQFTLRSLMLGTAACGGLFYVLRQVENTPCFGATTSSRLKWEERQAAIEQVAKENAALSEQAASELPSVESP